MKHEKAVVLLIDDDETFTESNKDLLETCGYTVYTANNGKSGLELAINIKPDIIILDVVMATETEGFEIAKKVPQLPELANTPVLLVTGMAEKIKSLTSIKPDKTWLPVDRILDKPVLPAVLISEIERLLKGRVL